MAQDKNSHTSWSRHDETSAHGGGCSSREPGVRRSLRTGGLELAWTITSLSTLMRFCSGTRLDQVLVSVQTDCNASGAMPNSPTRSAADRRMLQSSADHSSHVGPRTPPSATSNSVLVPSVSSNHSLWLSHVLSMQARSRRTPVLQL